MLRVVFRWPPLIKPVYFVVSRFIEFFGTLFAIVVRAPGSSSGFTVSV